MKYHREFKNLYRPSQYILWEQGLASVKVYFEDSLLSLIFRSVSIVTLLHEMYFLAKTMLLWFLTLDCHVMFTKVVNTKVHLGYEKNSF